jgi:hypothetical protein
VATIIEASWAKGPQESAQGAARNEQALGFVATHRFSQGRALKERRRSGELIYAVHGRLSNGTRFPAPIEGATLSKAVGVHGSQGSTRQRLGPPWADSIAPLARQQLGAHMRGRESVVAIVGILVSRAKGPQESAQGASPGLV